MSDDSSSFISSSAPQLLQNLLTACIIRVKDWKSLPGGIQEQLQRQTDRRALLTQLVEQHLLTEYQAGRIGAGKTFGLVLGNYRILDRLGAGGMGIVFKAEHLRLPRLVAIKVLPHCPEDDPAVLERFFAEMWTVAELHHPNILSAVDAGATTGSDPDSPTLHYFVMEYVDGQDLEHIVRENGPLEPADACEVIYEVASALVEARKHNLVHRDIKPSNILITTQGQVKLLDFGLARHFRQRLTEPGTVMGTADYIAPEQARDSRSVDIRADIYGLGGTLFWCLTGRVPFPFEGDAVLAFARRSTQPPPSVCALRPEIPASLDAIVARMMAIDPNDRYATPEVVMRSMLLFLEPEGADRALRPPGQAAPGEGVVLHEGVPALPHIYRVLLADDEADTRMMCRHALESEGLKCDEAANGLLAWEAIMANRYDLVLLDIDMPVMTGPEVLKRLREAPPAPHLKTIMVSGRASADEMAHLLSAGADDYLSKPLSLVQLQLRVQTALRLKDSQERSDLLNRNLLTVNHELEQNLTARDCDLVHARNALVLALAEMVAYRDSETGAHLLRLQRYSRCLAEEAAHAPAFAGQIDAHFVGMLECCAPLHDIGKIGLPDNILLKPGKLDANERILMQIHTTLGADMLQKVAKQHGFAAAFLGMATDIARHHHERYDGTGYPDRRAGNDIPLAARIVTVADVYDALRSRRAYKPALPHAIAIEMMKGSEGQFDPLLLQAFERCAARFEGIARDG